MKKIILLLAAILLCGLSCGSPKTADQAYHDYLMAIKERNAALLYNLMTPEAQQKLDDLAVKQQPATEADKPKPGRKYLKEKLDDCAQSGEFNDMTDHITDDLIKRLTPMGEVGDDTATFPGALGDKATFEKRDDGWRLKDEEATSLVERMERVNSRSKGKNEETNP
jgi:hypothetical protein